MQIFETGIPGCFRIKPRVFSDSRGVFVKTLHPDLFAAGVPALTFVEEYYSVSRRNVVRGLHFQTPPEDHYKMVYCMRGGVLDLVFDMRVGSPAYGTFRTFSLDAVTAEILIIPNGCAHGFLALEDDTIMNYKVTTAYAPAHDAGILWNSVGFDWPVESPIMSDRDRSFPTFASFANPFSLQR